MEKNFFKKMNKTTSVTPAQRSKEEIIVQTHMKTLNDFEAFNVKVREKLVQPGTVNEVPEGLAESFLQRDVTSKSIAEAVVEQTVLKNKGYNRATLKKTLVQPFPSMVPKQQKRNVNSNMEKKILTSLLYNSIKQQEGEST